MSSGLNHDEVLYIQRTCAACGLYQGPIDGLWSLAVDRAEAHFSGEAAKLKATLGTFDKRSEDNIATLTIAAQRMARDFMSLALEFRHSVKIISGTRTYAEQDKLYAIGRTIEKDRSPVTKAKGGQSNHNFGIAWDVGIFETDGSYMRGANERENDAYRDLATLAKKRLEGLEWGGDWSGFKDPPHYQVKTGRSVEEVRVAFEKGKPLFA